MSRIRVYTAHLDAALRGWCANESGYILDTDFDPGIPLCGGMSGDFSFLGTD
jgi:hypothetical protein